MHPVPAILHETVGHHREGRAWLETLPARIAAVAERWSLEVGTPIASEASCSWVAFARTRDGGDAVLKIGWPHMEAEHEAEGLRFWDGDPCVRLLDADPAEWALLLERCRPGRHLRELPEERQDEILAGLLRRLWRTPPPGYPFRTLAAMAAHWCEGILAEEDRWPEGSLVGDGVAALRELCEEAREPVLLATDLHAGNVLAAERRDWLVIDPKPFVGDRCYDATQHLVNCRERMLEDPHRLVGRMADLAGLDRERLRHFAFARFAICRGDDFQRTREIAARLSQPSPV
ncbi:MAG: aminoglycoside phosphotransferase family protein [Myxococcota bacterium]|nr:aminoglycoside phosphotransferase family protein [Myxococcota bacterium]